MSVYSFRPASTQVPARSPIGVVVKFHGSQSPEGQVITKSPFSTCTYLPKHIVVSRDRVGLSNIQRISANGNGRRTAGESHPRTKVVWLRNRSAISRIVVVRDNNSPVLSARRTIYPLHSGYHRLDSNTHSSSLLRCSRTLRIPHSFMFLISLILLHFLDEITYMGTQRNTLRRLK